MRLLQIQQAPILQMFGFVRKLVAGPKRKTPYNGRELDLTYITDRIIAMAYPASNIIEQTYRNKIGDVANYLNSQHQNYLIINVSSRSYNSQLFKGRVKEYAWPDHQAPPLTTLIEIAHEMKRFLEAHQNGVVAVHCNHGKGRTGTAIISFMLYVGFQEKAKEALSFYNQRRFNVTTYGVDQPCQTRYLKYVEEIKKIKQIPSKMIAYKLLRIKQQGLPQNCYISVHQTRSGVMKHEKLFFDNNLALTLQIMLIGDIFIQIYQDSWTGAKKIGRINCNLFFLNPTSVLNIAKMRFKWKGSELKLASNFNENFVIKLEFQYFCLCHLPDSDGLECQCTNQRKQEEMHWNSMLLQLKQAEKLGDVATYFYLQNQKESKKAKQKKKYEQLVIGIEGMHFDKKEEMKSQEPIKNKEFTQKQLEQHYKASSSSQDD